MKKTRTSPKRLSVNKQTLKSLTAQEAGEAHGGGTTPYTPYPSISCYNTNCCNSRVCP